MTDIQSTLSGIKIASISSDMLEVRVLDANAVRLYFSRDSMKLERIEVRQHHHRQSCSHWRLLTCHPGAQFQDSKVPTDDLVEVALRTNNMQVLLSDYRARLLGSTKP